MKSRIALIILMAALLLVPACSELGSSGEKKDEAVAGKAAQKGKILYWRSPMDPTYISDKPGKDPMGMNLVPVYAGEANEGPPGMVRIDPATTQNIGVETVEIHRKKLSHEIRTIGRVTYDEKKVYRISPKIDGWIERQQVNFAGQDVEKGEPLLEIYSPELVSTQQEYLEALRYHKETKGSSIAGGRAGAEKLLKATLERLRYWDITEAQIKALREKGKITRTMVLHAPVKGIVVERNIPEGGYLKTGQSVYKIADISTVWVYADIYEYEVPWLEPGQPMTMTLAYQPGVSYSGKVAYIYPYLQNMPRTLRVRMHLDNTRNFILKPGMWSNVVLSDTVTKEGLAVPVQAVLRTGTRNIAIVALKGGFFVPRDLKLGPQAGDEFEVLDGLKAGDRVVTSAQFLINSESNLQAAISKMTAGPKEAGH
jgi:Cu(I)/Ag(I) efflux system membrane fusion protein